MLFRQLVLGGIKFSSEILAGLGSFFKKKKIWISCSSFKRLRQFTQVSFTVQRILYRPPFQKMGCSRSKVKGLSCECVSCSFHGHNIFFLKKGCAVDAQLKGNGIKVTFTLATLISIITHKTRHSEM